MLETIMNRQTNYFIEKFLFKTSVAIGQVAMRVGYSCEMAMVPVIEKQKKSEIMVDIVKE